MNGRLATQLTNDLTQWRAGLLEIILRVAAGLGLIVYIPSVYIALQNGMIGVIVIDTIAIMFILGLLFIRTIPFHWRAGICFLFFFSLGTGLLVWVGSVSQIYLFGFSILVAILLGLRAGLAAAALSSLTMFVIGILGAYAAEMDQPARIWSEFGWLVITLNFTLVNVLLTLAIGRLLSKLDMALQREMAARVSLERERTLLRTLIDALPDVVFTKDLAGRYTLANPATISLVGLPDEQAIIGKTVFDLFPHELAASFHADDMHVVAGHPLLNREERSRDSHGNALWFLTIKVPLYNPAGDIIGLVGISRNITDRKKLEDQLHQAQKMEAIGQLAGGVAHDFNNMLTVIFGYCELVLSMDELEPTIRESVTIINEASERAASLTRQLLAFGRRSILQPEILDLNQIILETSKMLRRVIGEHIELTTILSPQLASIWVDPSQFNQVLINLVVNARDAMPQGGTLTIKTANMDLTADDAANLGCQPGRYVMLVLHDTGYGMPADVVTHIFEPFYTTKELGKGTGLGLSIIHGIVQQSGGGIQVESTPGQGTTFTIYFPVMADRPQTIPPIAATGGLHGSETILLVEDDIGVRTMILAGLRQHGYHVLDSSNSKEALVVIATYQGRIDLLLTDIQLPEMGGANLVDTLRIPYPQIKVLFMSGYNDHTVIHSRLPTADSAFIQKPFTQHTLIHRIRNLLDPTPHG